jgi:hypothetical protein
MKAQIIVFAIIFLSLTPIVILWIKGMEFMKENHPDYTGDDLFGTFDDEEENENDKHQIM